MTHSLRPYQKSDIEKLLQLDCGACFNEQRTGKTPIAINVMLKRNLNKILVVCPASMLYPWRDAWEEWGNITAVVCEGTAKKRRQIIEDWEYGPLIISYGSLRETVKTDGDIEYILNKRPEGCIADEAHRFKDPTTNTARAMYRLCKTTPYRLALTGTPATNKPIDIFGILRWLYPDLFKSYWKFAEYYFNIYEAYTGYNRHHKEIGEWKPGKEKELATWLSLYSTQRKRKDVMPWLPDKTYMDIKLNPTPVQLNCIKQLEDYFETDNVVVQGVLDQLLRIRQLCIAPALLGIKGNSPKIDWVLQFLKDYPNEPVLIFTKFTGTIRILQDEFEKKRIKNKVISGEVSFAQRNEIVNSFQRGEYNVLILQIDAGKEGLTLDRATTTIFIDQFPPAADIQQAEDRMVSTTIDKRDKANRVIRLILKDTYDNSLYELVKANANNIAVINDYINYLRKEEQ